MADDTCTCQNDVTVTPPGVNEVQVSEDGQNAVTVQPPAQNEVSPNLPPVNEVEVTPPPINIVQVRDPVPDIQDVEFTANGPYRIDTQVDGRHYNETGRPLSILHVMMHREKAGRSGNTTIDININGTTIYANQDNRPSVAYSEGDDAVDEGGTPDVTRWPNGTYVSLDIDAVEGGSRANLRVVLTAG